MPGDELAWAGHATPLPVIPIEAVGTGLRPADGSSVAPMGSPVGGTGMPGVVPSGEVVPIPGTVVPICATAGSQPNSTASIDAINAGRILACMLMRQRSAGERTREPKVMHRSSLIGCTGRWAGRSNASAARCVRRSEGRADLGFIEFGLFAIGAAALVIVLTSSLLTSTACSSGEPEFKYKA
jgi:hypothetical protein